MHDLWQSMVGRCRDKGHTSFARYGGRGITVCERWLTFDNFIADMGERPKGLSLDRIDNNGPYSPENCRWATVHEQLRNRRSTRFLTYRGKTLTIAEWARELRLSGNAARNLYTRLERFGNDAEKVLSGRFHPGQDRYMVTRRGKTKTLAEWSTELNIPLRTLHIRFNNFGDDAAKVLSQKYLPRGKSALPRPASRKS